MCRIHRRAKKYHIIDDDLFKSVEAAAKYFNLKKRDLADMIAVHMESDGQEHTFFATWRDGSMTQMTQEEIAAWAAGNPSSMATTGATSVMDAITTS